MNVGELTHAQLRQLLPRFHPLYANTAADVLAELARHAKGNLRRWACILEAALYLGADPSASIDSKTAHHVLRAINGSAVLYQVLTTEPLPELDAELAVA